MPGAVERLAGVAPPRRGKRLQRIAEHLAPLREHRPHHRLEQPLVPSGTAGGRNARRTTAEWTFGAGRNAPGGRVSSRAHVGVQLRRGSQDAVVLVPGARLDPLRDLALQHQRRVDEIRPASGAQRSSLNRIGDETL